MSYGSWQLLTSSHHHYGLNVTAVSTLSITACNECNCQAKQHIKLKGCAAKCVLELQSCCMGTLILMAPCGSLQQFSWLVQAVTESLPTSPAVGLGPPPAPSAPARTPLTGKKRAREGTEGILLPLFYSLQVCSVMSRLMASRQILGGVLLSVYCIRW